MDRRDFLIAAGALLARATSSNFKLGAISDGFSSGFDEALKTMKSYGLRWVEIRHVFGVYNTEASPAQIQSMKDSLKKHEFQVSVIDSALYKCTLPGATPAKASEDDYPYSGQMELLKRACDRAHAFGANKIRGFTFWRVAEPHKIGKRIAEELGKAAEMVEKAGLRLVIENEESCNAGTGRELSEVLSLANLPSLGANWDVGNGYLLGEAPFPDGYRALDKKRIWHMHLKGIKCRPGLKNCDETFAGEGQIDLLGQFKQLFHDGYQETMSLECEFVSPGLSHLETSKRSLQGLLKIMAEV